MPTQCIRDRVVGNGQVLEVYGVHLVDTRFGFSVNDAVKDEKQQHQATQCDAGPFDNFFEHDDIE